MLIKILQKIFKIEDWKGWISVENSKTCVLLDKKNKTFLIVLSYKDLFFDLPYSLIHEILHIKYPNASEKIIEKLTRYYIKLVWKQIILFLQYLLILLTLLFLLLLFSLVGKF